METVTFYLGEENGTYSSSSVEPICDCHINTMADSKQGIIDNIKMLIKDFMDNEWKNDAYWSKVNIDELEIKFIDYDFTE